MKKLRAVVDKLNKLDLYLCQLLFAVMFLTALAQVVCRFVFDASLGFSDELCRFCMIYIVFLAIPLSLSQGRMLRLELLIDPWLQRGGKRRARLYQGFSCIVVGGFYGLAALSALLMMRINSAQLSPALDIPMSLPYSAILIGGLLTLLNCVAVFDQPPTTSTSASPTSPASTSASAGEGGEQL